MRKRKFKMTAARRAALAKGAHSPAARAKAKLTRAATLKRKREAKAQFYNTLLEHGQMQKLADAAAGAGEDFQARAAKAADLVEQIAAEEPKTERLFIQWTPHGGGLTRSFTLAEAKECFNDFYLLFGAGRC